MTDDTSSRCINGHGQVVFGANGLETFRQEGIGVRSPAGDAGCQYHGWIHTVVWTAAAPLRQDGHESKFIYHFAFISKYARFFLRAYSVFYTEKNVIR